MNIIITLLCVMVYLGIGMVVVVAGLRKLDDEDVWVFDRDDPDDCGGAAFSVIVWPIILALLVAYFAGRWLIDFTFRNRGSK